MPQLCCNVIRGETIEGEIEALEAHALNPVRFLVVPRMAAAVVSLVCLAVIANIAAIAADDADFISRRRKSDRVKSVGRRISGPVISAGLGFGHAPKLQEFAVRQFAVHIFGQIGRAWAAGTYDQPYRT